nr:MAG TPA: hypothetical protein [Caudoviricetes sp.]
MIFYFFDFYQIPPILNFHTPKIITVSILLYTSPPKMTKIDTRKEHDFENK